MTRLRFLPQAEAELLHEVSYYSALREGLGVRFKDAVKAAAARAGRTPVAGAPQAHGTRCLRIKGFPFSLVYRDTPDEVLVVAAAPDSRKPGYWLARTGEG
jgi:plasmid stabilization system protein ParE